MRAREQRLGKAVLLALVFLMGVMQAPPSGCLDGCDDEEGSSCADCPLCSPGRAPVVLDELPGSAAAGPVFRQSFLPARELSRIEEREVFHVPRRLG